MERCVYCKWGLYNICSLSRFRNQGIILPVSAEQEDSARVLEMRGRTKLHMC